MTTNHLPSRKNPVLTEFPIIMSFPCQCMKVKNHTTISPKREGEREKFTCAIIIEGNCYDYWYFQKVAWA